MALHNSQGNPWTAEEEARVLDGKLVYVGVTRAKTRLIMTFTGAVTDLLPTAPGLYQESNA